MRLPVRALATLLLFSFSALGVAHGADAAEKGRVRIGLLDPRLGAFGPEGRDIDAGFRYFLATHADKLGGFDVELRTGDEGTSVANALAVAHELVETEGVDAIVGVLSSDDVLGIAGYLDDRRTPLIVTAAGADGLTQTDARRAVFRVARTSSQDDMPLGDYVCRHLRKRTAAIVAVDREFGWESAGGFARAYTDAGCRIVQEQYGAEDADWSALAGKIDRGASVVFASVGGVAAPPFLAAFHANGPKIELVGDGLLTDERVLGAERDAALGVVTALHYAATLARPANTRFRLGYESLGGRPVSQFVESGYVAAQALSAALDRIPAGTVRGDAIASALRVVRLDAPRGDVWFDAQQQVIDDVYIRRVDEIGGRERNDVIATYPAVSQYWRYDPNRYLRMPAYVKLKGTWAHDRTSFDAHRRRTG